MGILENENALLKQREALLGLNQKLSRPERVSETSPSQEYSENSEESRPLQISEKKQAGEW